MPRSTCPLPLAILPPAPIRNLPAGHCVGAWSVPPDVGAFVCETICTPSASGTAAQKANTWKLQTPGMPNWSAAALTLKLSPPVVWIGCNSVMTAWMPPTVNAPPPSTRWPGRAVRAEGLRRQVVERGLLLDDMHGAGRDAAAPGRRGSQHLSGEAGEAQGRAHHQRPENFTAYLHDFPSLCWSVPNGPVALAWVDAPRRCAASGGGGCGCCRSAVEHCAAAERAGESRTIPNGWASTCPVRLCEADRGQSLTVPRATEAGGPWSGRAVVAGKGCPLSWSLSQPGPRKAFLMISAVLTDQTPRYDHG